MLELKNLLGNIKDKSVVSILEKMNKITAMEICLNSKTYWATSRTKENTQEVMHTTQSISHHPKCKGSRMNIFIWCCSTTHICHWLMTWTSCQIREIAGAHAPGMPGTFSPLPQVSDPDMHHGTCVMHVPWCMPGSLTSGFIWNRRRGKTFPAFPAHAQPAILRTF